MMCLRGTLCLYQGEELGFPEAELSFEELQDPYGIEFWPEYKGRDGCRTPIAWDASEHNGGFTDGKSWLPVFSKHIGLNANDQEQSSTAMLHHYRRAIALRHAHAALVKGEQGEMRSSGNVLMFTRRLDNEEIFCAFNIGATEATFEMPEGPWKQVALELGSSPMATDTKQQLSPWQSCIAMKPNNGV